MNAQNILETLLNAVIVVAITGVVPAVVQYVREKISGSKIEEAVGIILDAVDQTNQTFADALRENGTFDEEKQKEALQMSLTAALSMMNDSMIKYLEKEFNDVEAWIAAKIEAACKVNKDARSDK